MTADAVGGVWTYALELARALEPHRLEVMIATMGEPPSQEQRRAAGELSNVILIESHFRLEWMNEPWEDVALAGEWLLGLEQRLKPDLIHLNGYSHAALPWRAPVAVVAHSCVYSWWRAVKGEVPPNEWLRYRNAVETGLQSADAVVAPSSSMLSSLYEHYTFDTPSRVVYNGRDASLFTPEAKERFVLTAGRLWDDAKNVRGVKEAAKYFPWPLYIAGAARETDPSQPASGRVMALGRLEPDAMRRWMSRASIYALPAYYEPFGLSLVEAALSGCALVAGDIPSMREIWNGAAVFVRPDDPREIAEGVNLLIADDEMRARNAAAARQRALQFTVERFAEGYLDLYRDLIRVGRKPITIGRAGVLSAPSMRPTIQGARSR